MHKRALCIKPGKGAQVMAWEGHCFLVSTVSLANAYCVTQLKHNLWVGKQAPLISKSEIIRNCIPPRDVP